MVIFSTKYNLDFIAVICLSLLLSLTACEDQVRTEVGPIQDKISDNESDSTLNQSYLQLISEINMVLINNNGNIHPDRYSELNSSIAKLEELKYNTERVIELRSKFSELKSPIMVAQNSSVESPVIDDINPKPLVLSSNPQQNISGGNASSDQIPVDEGRPTCKSNPNPVFTHHLTDLRKVSSIQTPPMIVSGSLKPHSYIDSNHKRVPVYAPTEMILTGGSFYENGPYTLDFQVSCEITLRVGHITEPIEEIRDQFPKTPAKDSRTHELIDRISFKAGDLIAYTTGTTQAGNWDFGVYDSTSENRYATDPEWNMSLIYTTAICPFDFFESELKAEYTDRYNTDKSTSARKAGVSFCNK